MLIEGKPKSVFSMLTRLIGHSNDVAETGIVFDAVAEYEFRGAEYEYEHEQDGKCPIKYEFDAALQLRYEIDIQASVQDLKNSLPGCGITQ